MCLQGTLLEAICLFVFSWSEIEILVHFFFNRINCVYLWVFVPDIDDSLDGVNDSLPTHDARP